MPRFVVLEHRWDGVHWDLMLEVESLGALRTWAVDIQPAPGVETTARALPDHRLAYLDYEGPISRDRGEVSRVAEGTYSVLDWSDDCVLVELEGASLRGTVDLTREPDRIAGDTMGAGASTAAADLWRLRIGNAVRST